MFTMFRRANCGINKLLTNSVLIGMLVITLELGMSPVHAVTMVIGNPSPWQKALCGVDASLTAYELSETLFDHSALNQLKAAGILATKAYAYNNAKPDEKIKAVSLDDEGITGLISQQKGINGYAAFADADAYLEIGAFWDSAGVRFPEKYNWTKGERPGQADSLATGTFGIVGKTSAPFPWLKVSKQLTEIAVDPPTTGDEFVQVHLGADYDDLTGRHTDLWDADIVLGSDGNLVITDSQGLLTISDFEKTTFFDAEIGQEMVEWRLKSPKELSWLVDISRLPLGTEVSAMGTDSILTHVAAAPEPSFITLFSTGTLVLLGCAWRRRKKSL